MRKKIFGGQRSKEMWRKINNAKTFEDVREAMYSIGCHCQELEAKVNKLEDELRKMNQTH